MFVVVTILGVWLALQFNRARNQQAAINRVHHLGGHVEYDYKLAITSRSNGRARRANDFKNPSTVSPYPAWLIRIVGMDYLHELVFVDLGKKAATDEDLAVIDKVTSIQNLNLSDTKITSKGLRHLMGLTDLKCLFLLNTNVDDEGLGYLKGHQQLQILMLDGTDITDSGLVNLRGMTELDDWLGLGHTQVSDAGLENLTGLPNQRTLHVILRDTNVSRQGVARLRAALPKVDITDSR